MRRFLKKILYFLSLIVIFACVVFISMDLFVNRKQSENSIFIWGDFQAYQGFDLELLAKTTNKTIFSAAKHGAGVYDFLVFANKVPKKSTILLSISKPMQLRRKENDYNRSGISLSSLITLKKHNYSFLEIIEILNNNIKQPCKSLYISKNPILYNYADSIVFDEPIQLFNDIYKNVPEYLFNKQDIFLIGLEILKKKNCEIYLIEFPYHPILVDIESQSPIFHLTDRFFNKAILLSNNSSTYILDLDNEKQVMHDLTHLNKHGAELVTNFIADKLGTDTIMNFQIIY